MAGVEIKIPKVKEEEVVQIPKGSLGDIRGVETKVDQLGGLIYAIVASVIVSGMAVIIAVIGIFLDQMHFNNAAFKDYAEKNSVLEQIRSENNSLMQDNKNNQTLIIGQQKQLLELMKKK